MVEGVLNYLLGKQKGLIGKMTYKQRPEGNTQSSGNFLCHLPNTIASSVLMEAKQKATFPSIQK
jgi:hypothetical protein